MYSFSKHIFMILPQFMSCPRLFGLPVINERTMNIRENLFHNQLTLIRFRRIMCGMIANADNEMCSVQFGADNAATE